MANVSWNRHTRSIAGVARASQSRISFLNANAVPGLICAFEFDASGRGRSLPEAQVKGELPGQGNWLWLHLNFSDWRCRRWLEQTLGFPAELTSEICGPPLRQHVSAWEGVLFGHLADFRREFDSDSTEFSWLHFALGERFLITGRVRAVQSAERLRQVIGVGHSFARPASLLSHLLSLYTDSLDMALHRLSDELEMIEDHVLDEHHRGERKRLMLTRREIAQLHRHMRAMRRALQTAERASIPTPEGFALTAARLNNLDQDFADMEARARFFHDEIDAKLTAETNRQLFTLSALTAAFLPPALVAGMFGMNVEGIPFTGAPWGFWAAAGLCGLSSGAVILYLKLMDRG
ncbi:CorA family divalent cation transporter [Aestuariivirga sp.]|uniref:CorA family divalent cation transporter n=1 Tax=Aestuariivirga sp. TaxID=2650926 RepID=UPI00301B30ED